MTDEIMDQLVGLGNGSGPYGRPTRLSGSTSTETQEITWDFNRP